MINLTGNPEWVINRYYELLDETECPEDHDEAKYIAQQVLERAWREYKHKRQLKMI